MDGGDNPTSERQRAVPAGAAAGRRPMGASASRPPTEKLGRTPRKPARRRAATMRRITCWRRRGGRLVCARSR